MYDIGHANRLAFSVFCFSSGSVKMISTNVMYTYDEMPVSKCHLYAVSYKHEVNLEELYQP